MSRSVRSVLLKVHLYTGMTLGLYLVVMGLSGSVLVFHSELEGWLNPGLHHVEPAGEPLGPSAVIAVFRERYPEAEVSRLVLPDGRRGAGGTYCFWVGPWEGDQPRVYVDPYRGEVIAERSYTGTLLGWVEYLHFALLGGMTGWAINAYLALATLTLLATGLVLWWPRKVRQLGQRLWVKWRAPWPRMNWDLHHALGVWTLPILVVLCLTGAAFAFWYSIEASVRWAVGETEPVEESYEAPEEGRPRSMDALLATAAEAAPRATPVAVRVPGDVKSPLTVYMRPGGDTQNHRWVKVKVDHYSGAVMDVHRYDETATARVMSTILPLHAGSIGGMPLRVLWCMIGLTPAVGMATGVGMWWRRSGRKWGKRRVRRRAVEERVAAAA